jgi:hypothetical protein
VVCTTLTPPRTQYGATHGKAQKRNPSKYAGTANPCNALFITRNEIRSAVRVRSSASTIWFTFRDQGDVSSVRQARHLAVADGAHDQAVIVADERLAGGVLWPTKRMRLSSCQLWRLSSR